jgi:hypothetical protein
MLRHCAAVPPEYRQHYCYSERFGEVRILTKCVEVITMKFNNSALGSNPIRTEQEHKTVVVHTTQNS